MANRRLPVRKIKEILRLKHACGFSKREIAQSCNVPRSTVGDYLMRARAACLDWSEASGLSDAQIESRLFPTEHLHSSVKRPAPDCDHIHRELRSHSKLNLTLTQLWLEYKEQHPNGYQYTQFCEHYRRWLGDLDYCMRVDHKAGEKLFIDYCDGISIVDPVSGEKKATQMFVAVWGASNYTYAEASFSQSLPDWIASHIRAFNYFGCIPKILTPDNLKSGVTFACPYEPEPNLTYQEMAEHYGCTILPARPYRPRDKAKVETGVLIVQRWILAVLRHRTFYSLEELNRAIREHLERLNTRILRRLGESRREVFESVDKPAAHSLPEREYQYGEWRKAKVNIDYHIEVDHHYYSVHYKLLKEKLEVRLSASTVEVFRKGERVASHARSHIRGGHTTLKDHMPPEHRQYSEWSPSRFIQWASKTGPNTAKLVETIIREKAYPEQGYRASLGILRLSRSYEPERIEAAARRALKYNTCSYRSMRSILSAGLDRRTEEEDGTSLPSLKAHDNIRGKAYYSSFLREVNGRA